MRVLVIGSILVAVLAVASCTSAPADSGIKGLVTIGPTSPVQQQGESGVAPYSATIVVKDVSGGAVAEVASGADGRFSVNLAPGRYVLESKSTGTLPLLKPQEVSVEPHRFTEVTVQYDSGIR